MDIGFKSEGVIPARELSIRNDIHPEEIVSLGEHVEAQPQRGERCPQLMRHVSHHGLVPVHEGLQAGGHPVEVGGQPAHLGRACRGRRAGGEVPGTEPLRG